MSCKLYHEWCIQKIGMCFSGIADLPLHTGRAPKWLFSRMKSLGKEIIRIIVDEYGKKELLLRLGDPCWFQSLGCLLGYDWHSSGITTVLTAVIREALEELNAGVALAGGKGRRSLSTPEELSRKAEFLGLGYEKMKKLLRISFIAAKVDNAVLQDGYSIYHHAIVFSEEGYWTVVQQGMNSSSKMARRYHWTWLSTNKLVVEPHSGIVCNRREREILDMTSRSSEENRKASLDLIKEGPGRLRRIFREIYYNPEGLSPFLGESPKVLVMPRRIDWKAVERAYELDPKDYEELVSLKGIGPSLLRALSLTAEVVYGAKASRRDPVKFSFAFGGKDGVPYPVDVRRMDEVIEILRSDELTSKLLRKVIPENY